MKKAPIHLRVLHTLEEGFLRLRLRRVLHLQTTLRDRLATLSQERSDLEDELTRRAEMAERCPSRGLGDQQCGNYAGHPGAHTLLIPTGAPWFPRQASTPKGPTP